MRSLGLCAGALLLSACLPLQTYYQTGVSLERLQADELACEVQALKDAPVSYQLRVAPPRYIPARQICDSQGTCVTRAGYWIAGETYTVDVNASLRRRVEQACMAGRGYAPQSIPACPAHVARAVPTRATSVLPPLEEGSCVIRNQDGTFQIVTRRTP